MCDRTMGGEESLEPHLEPEPAALKKQVRAGFSTRTAQPSAGNDGATSESSAARLLTSSPRREILER